MVIEKQLCIYKVQVTQCFHMIESKIIIVCSPQNDHSTEDLHIIGSRDLSILRGKVSVESLSYCSVDLSSGLVRRNYLVLKRELSVKLTGGECNNII